MAPTKSLPLDQFLTALAAKQPTPGGGAAAAIVAAIGSAAARMAAAYTTRRNDEESAARELMRALDASTMAFVEAADEDAEAYADLRRSRNAGESWEKSTIEARALAIPTSLLESCHANVKAIHAFLPHCNANITSDAKAGIHQLAGAARAAYQVRML